jgi:hypothetical protein
MALSMWLTSRTLVAGTWLNTMLIQKPRQLAEAQKQPEILT